MKRHYTIVMLVALLSVLWAVEVRAQSNSVLFFEDFQSVAGSGTGIGGGLLPGGSKGSSLPLPAGWDASDNDVHGTTLTANYTWKCATGGWYPVGSSATNQIAAFLSANNTYMSRAALKSPAITMTPGRDVTLSFKCKTAASGGSLDVYYSTDGGATYLNNVLATGLNPGTTYRDYRYAITGVTAQQIKIVFVGHSSGLSTVYSYYIDNVEVALAPTCQAPAGLYVSGVSRDRATINWGLAGRGFGFLPDTFHLSLFDAAGNAVAADTILAGTQSFTFNSLAANTAYTARVLSSCRANYKGLSDPAEVQFITASDALPLPYIQNFDGLTALPSGCYGTNATINTAVAYAYGGSGKSLKLTTTASDNAQIIFPPVDASMPEVEMDFVVRRASTSYVMNYVAGYTTDPYDASTFVPIASGRLDIGTAWQSVRLNAPEIADTARPVMMSIIATSGAASQIYIDNINIHRLPTCRRAENVTITDITANSATVTWQAANAGQYIVTALNPADSSTTTFTSTSNTVALTGLMPNTQYDVTVAGVCSATDTAETSQVVRFATRCDAAASPIFAETFDNLASNAAPQCWLMGWIDRSTSTKEYPFTSSTSYKHGTTGKSMMLNKQPDGTRSYLATRALPLDSAGAYDLAIWVYRWATSTKPNEGIRIWVTPTADDTAGGTALGFIPGYYLAAPAEAAGSQWYRYEYNIPVTGTHYIMIEGVSENGSNIFFDDLEVYAAPTCRKVTDIRAGTVTQTTARMSWTPGNNHTAYQVAYSLSTGAGVTADTVVVTTPQCTISGLTPATAYAVTGTVSAICAAGDTAEAVPFDFAFRTACVPLTELPYTQGFEDDESDGSGTYALPVCWTRQNNGTTQNYYPYNSAGAPHRGSKALTQYLTNSTTGYGDNVSVALRPIDTSIYPFAKLRLGFWATLSNANGSYCNGQVIVGVMSDPLDITTFVDIDTVVIPATGTAKEYKPYRVSLAGYTGSGSYVAMRFPRPVTGSNNLYIDDLTLDTVPDCADLDYEPLEVTGITANSIAVRMTDSTAVSAWSLAYGPEGTDAQQMTVVNLATDTFTITGLNSNTVYTLMARRRCSGDKVSPWSDAVSARTPILPAEVPYVCGFEDATENANWLFANAVSTSAQWNNWAIGSARTAVKSGLAALYVSPDRGTTYAYTIAGAISKSFAYRSVRFEEKLYTVRYNYRVTGGENNTDFGRVMLVPASVEIEGGAGVNITAATFRWPDQALFLDPDNLTNTTPEPQLSCMANAESDGWGRCEVTVDMRGRSGVYNLAVMWNNDGTAALCGSEPLAIDDISIEEQLCSNPAQVNISRLSSDSVTLTYTRSAGTSWEVVVDTGLIDIDNIPRTPLFHQTDATGSVAVGGLVPSSEYSYTLRAICAGGDTASWIFPVTFRSACVAASVPYAESFDNAATARCWTHVSATGSATRTEVYAHTGLASLMVDKATTVSPEFNVNSFASYQLTGYVYTADNDASMEIGLMTDPLDIASFESFGTVAATRNRWQPFVVYFTELNNPDYADHLAARNIAIVSNRNVIYLDDLRIEPAASCMQPTEPVIDQVTDTSFRIGFTNNSGATDFVVRLNNRTEIAANTNPFTVAGLMANTIYSVSVAAICSATDTSAYTPAGSVTTGCAPKPLPWTCSFEAEEGYVSAGSYSQSVLVEACWATLNNKPAGANSPYAYPMRNTNSAHSGSAGLQASASSTAKTLYLALPEFNAPANALAVSFYYKANNPTASVGYMTDPEADSTFVLLATLPATSGSLWSHFTATTDQVPNMPASARLAIHLARPTSSASALIIDDITVNRISDCAAPQSISIIGITDNGASALFTDAQTGHSAWQYVCGPAGTDPDRLTPQSISSADDTIVLTGLEPETRYELFVRAHCDTAAGLWLKAGFTTGCAPYHVTATQPYFDSFEDSENDKPYNGCYTTFGTSTTIYPKGKVNTINLTSASPYTIRYSHTGTCALNMTANKSADARGLGIIRSLHLEAGTIYKAQVFARAYGNPALAKLCLGTSREPAGLTTLASRELPATSTRVIPEHDGEPRCTDYAFAFRDVTAYFTVPATGVYYVAVVDSFVGTASAAGLYIDDLSVEAMTGCEPAPVEIDSVTATSITATVRYSQPGQSYDYCLIDPYSGDTVVRRTVVQTAQFTTPDIPAGRRYILVTRRLCDDGRYSPEVSTEVSTDCAPYQITATQRFIDSFEDDAVHNSAFKGYCYEKEGETNSYFIKSYGYGQTTHYAHNGESCLYMYSSKSACPTGLTLYREFRLRAGVTYDVTVYGRAMTYTTNLIISLGTNRADMTAIGSFEMPSCTAVNNDISMCWQRYRATFTVPADGDYYIGINVRCIEGKTSAYAYIDDLVVREQPTCDDPEEAPTVCSTTRHTALVSQDMGSAASVEVEWRGTAAGSSVNSAVVSEGSITLSSLAASAGYRVRYRRICAAGDTSVWSPYASFATKSTDCFVPENPRVAGLVTDHQAALTWGRAPESTAYSYELLSGSDTIAAGITAADTVVFDSLPANTNFTFVVRGNCSSGVNQPTFVTFRTETTPVNVPFVCSFETEEQSSCWRIRSISGNNNLVIGTDTAAVWAGVKSLYVSNNGSTYWYTAGLSASTAEILVNMAAGTHEISYKWKCRGELNYDYGRLFLLPATASVRDDFYKSATLRTELPVGAIALGDAQLSMQTGWQNYSGRFRVPKDGLYRLMVATVADATGVNQPPFAIDDLAIRPLSCDLPLSVGRIGLTDTAATLLVARSSADKALLYGLTTVNNADSVDAWTLLTDSVDADTIALAGLNAGTTYYFFARHACDSTNLSEVISTSFATRAVPRDLPYVSGFETGEDITGWTMTDGGARNRWMIGTEASYLSRRSLYVSDNGADHNYSGSSADDVSYSYAYIPFNLERLPYQLDFDWICKGESTYDYMRVFLMPAGTEIPENTAFDGLTSSTSLPNATELPFGARAMDGGSKLNLADTWQHGSYPVVVTEPGVYNLVFCWHNDAATENQPAAAVDNINFRASACPVFDPSTGCITNVCTDSTIDLTVIGNLPGSAIGYDVSTTDQFTDHVAAGITALGDSLIHIGGLTSSTRYYVRLWAVCDSGRTVSSSMTMYFNTACGPIRVYPWLQGFEGYNTGTASKGELLGNCWNISTTNPSVSSYVSTTPHDGAKGLFISHGGLAATQTFTLPEMADLEGKHVSFYYKFMNPNAAYIEVGYSTPSAFVALDTLTSFINWAFYEANLPTSGLPQDSRLAFRMISWASGLPGGLVSRDQAAIGYIDDIRVNARVQAALVYDTVCNGSGYNRHGINVLPGGLAEGDTALSTVMLSTTPGVADSIYTVQIHVLPQIAVVTYDTICAGQPYNRGGWTIARPQTTAYTDNFVSHNGCDSAVVLYLTVLSSQRYLADTICQGSAYQLGDSLYTRTGTYVHYEPNAYGCTDTITLNLTVVDSLIVTTRTICGGRAYSFEGNNYTASGVYRVTVAGAKGCTQVRELRLTVLPEDSTIDVTICQGGQALVVDTVVSTAGSYRLVRVNDAGCDITYHINVTVTPPKEGHYTDDACEGRPYNGYGVTGLMLSADTTLVFSTTTAEHCDSLTYVQITFRPTQYGDTTATIGEEGYFEWHDNTYTEPGDYQTTLRDQYGCDSVVTLHILSVGVDDVLTGRVRIAPNPVAKGQAAVVFTDGIGLIDRVELINSFGAVVDASRPHSTPLDLRAPQASGVYHIRIITHDGRVYTEKLVVR